MKSGYHLQGRVSPGMAKRLRYAGFRQPEDDHPQYWYDDHTGIPFVNREIDGSTYRCCAGTGVVTGNLSGNWQASGASFAVPIEDLVQHLPPGYVYAPSPQEIGPVTDLDADGYALIWLTLGSRF